MLCQHMIQKKDYLQKKSNKLHGFKDKFQLMIKFQKNFHKEKVKLIKNLKLKDNKNQLKNKIAEEMELLLLVLTNLEVELMIKKNKFKE